MSAQSENLLSQIKDIRGLDAFPWWPVPPGWWFLIAAVLGAVLLFVFAVNAVRLRRARLVWKREAERVLSDIRNDRKKSDRDKIVSLSILLRKLAIRKHGREKCAGLEGQAWLRWLSQHDPASFDWEREGKLITEASYAPMDAPVSKAHMDKMTCAVERWLR